MNFLISIAHAQVSVGGASTPPSGDLQSLVLNIYNLALLFGGLLAFLMILLAAVKYALQPDNSGAQSDARDQILQAFFGLLLLLGAYIVLNTINPEIVNLKIPQLTPLPPGQEAGQGLDDSAARRQLTGAGVEIKAGVSLAGVQQAVIQEAISLKSTCGCQVVITAGTDGQHKTGECSHGNGYKIDLRPTPDLSSYIKSHFAGAGIRGDKAPLYKNPSTGALYAYEDSTQGADPHWDVVAGCR